MRDSRLLSILILLQTRGRMSADALAQEFEVSVRTIYRDVDQLSAAGVPIYAERGRAGGFELMEGYRTRLTGFTEKEAASVLLAGAGAAAADLGLGAELAAAQLKLVAALPADAGAGAQRVGERFHLDPVDWYRRSEPNDLLPALAGAVWRERRVRMTYESWKETVRRDVAPLGLVLKAGVWYLVALADKQPRTYRVSNMTDIEVTDRPFVRPRTFHLARYWRAWSRDFEARILKDKATVKLSPQGLKALRDINPAAADAVDANHRPCRPQGWVRADIPIESVEHACGQLLRLRADVEVIDPLALRHRMIVEVKRIAALYA